MLPTLTAYLARQAELSAQRPALVYVTPGGVQRWNFGELWDQVRRVAGWLRQVGWHPGDRGVIILENRPEWVITYFGLLLAGGTAVPLDVQSRPEYVSYILQKTRPRLVVAGAKAPVAEIAAAAPELSVLVAETPPGPWRPWAELLTAPLPTALPELQPDDLASIIFTSGTTGPPKGVMLSHRNFAANYESIRQVGAITPEDNFLALLPLFHAFPFTATLLAPLFTGARVTFLATLQAEAVLRCLKEQGITVLAVTPQVLEHFYRGLERRLASLPAGLGQVIRLLLNATWQVQPRTQLPLHRYLSAPFRRALGKQFRYFVSGGAKLPAELALNFAKLGFTILEGYGLTETAPVVSLNPPEAPRFGSVGQPLAGIQVRVHQPDAQGVGEILIRGDNVMVGYFDDPEATAAAKRDGWFYSGDLGYLDADGYLYIQGRVKDIIVLRSGKNISAAEVAHHYLQAPAIKEIFILPDAQEEKLAAVIVPDFDYFRQAGETDLYSRIKWYLDYYSQQLEPYKRIRDFVITNQELPKTRLGKVQQHEAARIYRELAGRRYQAKKSALEEDLSPTARQVVELLLALSGRDLIALTDHLELDLGLDSLALVELTAALEERFHLRLPEEGLAAIFTVAELLELIDRLKPTASPAPLPAGATWTELLAQPPPEDLRRRLELGHPWGARLFTAASALLLGLAARAAFRLRVTGAANLPLGPALICPNHASFLDGFLIFVAVPARQRLDLFFQGTTYYFDLPLIRRLVKALRVIPVDSARHLVAAMQASAYVLKHGKLLCIFPEGARSVTGEMGEIKKGVLILAQELRVPLIPAYIQGSHAAWSPQAAWPRPHPIRIHFGRSWSFAALAARGRRRLPAAGGLTAAALGLKEAILDLRRQLDDRSG